MSDHYLVETAKNAIQSAACAKDPEDCAERMAVHDAAVHELKLRLFEHAAAKLGLRAAAIPAAALARVNLDL